MQYDTRHGGPWDRGGADSYYNRSREPHYYVGGTGTSELVTRDRMTESEIAAYDAGYDENEQQGDKKDYG